MPALVCLVGSLRRLFLYSYDRIKLLLCTLWLNMLFISYDVSLTYEHVVGLYCKSIWKITLDSMLCEVNNFLWSFVWFTWFSKDIGIYLVIEPVGGTMGYGYGSWLYYDIMNFYIYWLDYTWWCWSCVIYGHDLRVMSLLNFMSSWMCIRLLKVN